MAGNELISDMEREELDEMKNSLLAISQEVQRCRTLLETEQNERNTITDSDLPHELELYKAKLKNKRKLVKSLKENLKTACMIAKKVIEAKEMDSHIQLILKSFISNIKDTPGPLLNLETVKLSSVNDQLQNITNFIELGYEKLIGMKGESQSEDIPVMVKLKHIMVSCGRYYTDYCNEFERCRKLEQRNRYLCSKIVFLENSLANASEQMAEIETQNNKSLSRRNSSERQMATDMQAQNVYTVISTAHQNPLQNNISGAEQLKSTSDIDLSSHLCYIGLLLDDQDTMLQNLKTIANEFTDLKA